MASPSERAMDDVKYYYALANDQPFHLPSDLSACMDAMDLRGPAYISPFVTSIERARPLVFEALAKSETVKNWRNEDGASALHKIFGVRNATAHHVNMLCQNIDPNVTAYPSLDKPIHYAACWRDRGGMLKALLDHPNIEVNAQTIDGSTPAHALANLVRSTEKRMTVNGVNERPFVVGPLLDTFSLLKNAGANFAIKNNDGHTPIDLLRRTELSKTQAVSEFIARHEAAQSKQALLDGLDKQFVATEQEAREPTRQRRM